MAQPPAPSSVMQPPLPGLAQGPVERPAGEDRDRVAARGGRRRGSAVGAEGEGTGAEQGAAPSRPGGGAALRRLERSNREALRAAQLHQRPTVAGFVRGCGTGAASAVVARTSAARVSRALSVRGRELRGGAGERMWEGLSHHGHSRRSRRSSASIALASAADENRELAGPCRCSTSNPHSSRSRAAIRERWQASGSRSTQSSAAELAPIHLTIGAEVDAVEDLLGVAAGVLGGEDGAGALALAAPRRPRGTGAGAARWSAPAPSGGCSRCPPRPAPSCRRRALAQAYSLPRTPRRWRTSSTRSISGLARGPRGTSRGRSRRRRSSRSRPSAASRWPLSPPARSAGSGSR